MAPESVCRRHRLHQQPLWRPVLPGRRPIKRPPGRSLFEETGLGVVSFGQHADEVIPVLEALIGSTPTDTGSQADWVEFVGWSDLGLFVGFDTPAAQGYSGVSRFVGWEYFGSDGDTIIATVEGAGIGTAFSQLQALYVDRLEVSTAIDECVSGPAYLLVLDSTIYGMLDRSPDDDGRVSILRAGVGVGC
ncbi:MAG: hypothetical protein OES24_21960 [Acidimicrobiia bacterium]|nr:hypothetical protein [Acidimicrobiia bacterium]